MDFPDPWPITYSEPADRTITYACFMYLDPKLGLVEFFAPEDSTDNMRQGWVHSWRRKHPDWP